MLAQRWTQIWQSGLNNKARKENILNTKMFSICILLIISLLTGCVTTSESMKTSFPTTATAQAFASPSLSDNSESPMPIITQTAAMPTLMLVPTLGMDNGFEILRNYLKNKPPCQLPCWGGITPGKSTLSDVQKQLTAFSGISERAHFGESGDSWIAGNFRIKFDEKISIWPHYLASSNNETILFVSILTGSKESKEGAVYAGSDYNELFFAYTLSQIVSTYGLPAQTFMTADINVAESTAPDFFVIRLLYPDLGIFVSYTMPAETSNNNYKFCPDESVIYLRLIPQGHGNDYKDFLNQLGEDNNEWSPSPANMPFYKSTEEALQLTDEEFYQLITTSPNPCFESPINIWPKR